MSDVDDAALRPEETGDEPFLEALYASTRAGELSLVAWSAADKAAFLKQQYRLRSLHYRAQHPGAEFLVVVDAGKPIGRLCVCRNADEVRLVDVALLPEHRGHGIGGRLVREVLERAAGEGRRVTAHVAHDNPARRLYERLGFRVVSGEGMYLALECSTAPRASPRNQDAGTAEQHD